MGSVTARAEQIVADLVAAGKPATADVRKVSVPGFLLVPIPKYDFDTHLDGSSTLTWSLYALAKQPGDLQAAKALEELVLVAAGVLDFETATPSAYQLPSASDPHPAYLINFTDDLEVNS